MLRPTLTCRACQAGRAVRILLATLALLLAAVPARRGESGEEPTTTYAGVRAEDAARWLRDGDEVETARVVRLLVAAPEEYVEAVVLALRRLPDSSPPAAAPETVAEVPPELPAGVRIHIRVVSAPRGALDGLTAGTPGPNVLVLDNQAALRVLAAVRTRDDLRTTASPTLLVLAGQRGSLSVGNTIPYVQGFDVRRTGGEPRADPVMDQVWDGLALELQPELAHDGRALRLVGWLRQSHVDVPLAEEEIRLEGLAEPVTIQTPRVREVYLPVDARTRPGGYVVVRGLLDPDDETRESFALIGASLQDPPPPSGPRLGVPLPLELDFRLLAIDPALAADLLGEDPFPATAPASRLPDGVAARLHQEGDDLRIVERSSLSVVAGRKGHLSRQAQTSYVRDYDVRETSQGGVAVDPIVDVVQHGLTFDLGARWRGRDVAVDIETTIARLRRPIAEATVRIGGREVTVQLPEIDVRHVRANVQVPEGAWAVVGGMGTDDDGFLRLVLVRPKRAARPR